MSIVYLFALAAFSVAMLCVLFEACYAVSRKPVWTQARMPSLRLVENVDRRIQDLPFVGSDRRGNEPLGREQSGAAAREPLRAVGS